MAARERMSLVARACSKRPFRCREGVVQASALVVRPGQRILRKDVATSACHCFGNLHRFLRLSIVFGQKEREGRFRLCDARSGELFGQQVIAFSLVKIAARGVKVADSRGEVERRCAPELLLRISPGRLLDRLESPSPCPVRSSRTDSRER